VAKLQHLKQMWVSLKIQATVEFAKKGFNNEGTVGPEKHVDELSPEGRQSLIHLNLNGVFYVMRYQVPAILVSSGG